MANRFRGGEREQAALGAYVKLLRAAESVSARVFRSLAEVDLTPSQFAVLEAIYHLGPLCLSDIARKILKSGGNLTMVVNNLEKRGLVQRRRQKDRRFFLVAPTRAGVRLMQRYFPRHAARIGEAMSGLSAGEQAALGDLCRKLGLAAARGPVSE